MIKTASANEPRVLSEREKFKGKTRLLLFCNALSLDAAAVATTWLLLFADCFRLTVPVGNSTALFLTVWLIYLVDRFIDSLSLAPDVPRSARQMFWARNQNLCTALIWIIGLLDVAIICFALDWITIFHGIVLGSIVAAYLVINWSWSKLWTVVPVKETIIGLLFAAGTLLALSPGSVSLPGDAFIAGGFFGVLCFGNCISVASWERGLDRIQNKHSIATRFGRMLRLRDSLTVNLAVGSFSLVMINRETWPLSLCIAVSSIAISALDKISVSRDERSALADLALLTPAIFLAIRSLL